MREIEFRAWDKEINEMIFQQKRSPCFGRFEGESWCSLEDVLFYYKQSFVLMQYTGLKDRFDYIEKYDVFYNKLEVNS